MPIYSYICDNCGHALEQYEKFHEKRRRKCPNCRKHKLYVDVSGVGGQVYGEVTTIQHLADRNSSKAGRYQLEDAQEKMVPRGKKKEKVWWRDSDKVDTSLANLTPKQTKKYIETGEKP